MTSPDGRMNEELAAVLEPREGWTFEAQTTPGSDPCWAFCSNGRNEISVTVDDGAIAVYLMDVDKEIRLPDHEALVTWISENPILFTSEWDHRLL